MALFVVGRPLWFYLRGLNEKESTEIKSLIVENGGKIAITNSPPIMTFTTRESHVPGNVEFSIEYIRQCVAFRKILNLTAYNLYEPGPYDGCLMSIFLYQHGNCGSCIIRSRTSRYPSHEQNTAEEDSMVDIQTARQSPDIINTIDQFEKLSKKRAAKLGTNVDVESTSELVRESLVPNHKKKMKIGPPILVGHSSSVSVDIIPNMEESVLEMPSVMNDLWITNEDVENLIPNDTGCPALKSLRFTDKRTQELLPEGSLIGEVDEKKSKKAEASSQSVSNVESLRNSTSANVTVDKDTVPLQNESALSKGGTNLLKTFPRSHQKVDTLHSRSTNQELPLTVTETIITDRETLSPTSMVQVFPQADGKTNIDEQKDKSKFGTIKTMKTEIPGYNLLNDDIQFIWQGNAREAYSSLRDSTVKSDIKSDDSDDIIVPWRKTSFNVIRKPPVSFKSFFRSSTCTRTNIAKTKSQHATDTSKPSTSSAGTNIAKTKSQQETDTSKPSTSSGGTTIAKTKSQHETDTSKPSTSSGGTNIAKTKSQHETDTSKPSTSSGGTNIAKTKSQHETDTSKPSTSSARTNIAKTKSPHETDTSKPSTSSAGTTATLSGKWHKSKDANSGRDRKKFTEEERQIMLRYLIKNDCIQQVMGLRVWQDMVDSNLLPCRTASSLNNHFRKSLIHDVLDYKMPESMKNEFRKVKRRILKKQRRL